MTVSQLEQLVLNGVALHDSTFGLAAVAFPPPRQRQEWIGAADSEAQLLVRNPKHENRTITATLQVAPQADMDTALGKVALIVDALAACSEAGPDGVPMTWTPANSNLTCTFDVLSGEITDMPIDWAGGWLIAAPTITIELKAKPYWRGETITITAVSSTDPIVTLEIPDVPGDVPALGVLTVTDVASQSRRHVEWGLEGPETYDPTTELLIDSETLVTTGFSGAAVALTGGYDPPSSGGDTAVGGLVYTAPQAVCGLPNLDHVGVFRVKARVMTNVTGTQVRLAWQAGDGPLAANPWVEPHVVTGSAFDTWCEVDLGTITIPVATSGAQRWTGRIEAYTAAGGEVYVDYLVLIPVTAGYGKARASFAYSAGVLAGVDDFTGTTAGSGLNARATTGGTWATSGATTDFTFADDLSGEQIRRFTGSDSGPRYAVLGSTNYTNTTVQVLRQHNGFVSGAGLVFRGGVLARWVDANNHLRAYIEISNFPETHRLVIATRVASTDLEIGSAPLPSKPNQADRYYAIRLTVFDSGRAIAELLDSTLSTVLGSTEGSSTTLATGGALDDGKPGLFDYTTTSTSIRYYDNFQVSVPPAEPIVIFSGRSIEFAARALREDATGTYTGRPQSYNPSPPFLVPPGTSRVLVKARRGDVVTAADQSIADDTEIGVAVTARGLVVPR